MNIRSISQFFVSFSLILLLGLSPSFAQKQNLIFAPPDGTSFYENVKMSRTTIEGDESDKDDLEIQSSNELKKVGNFYVFNSQLVNFQIYHNDRRGNFPFISKLTNMTITYTLDTNGKVIKVQGFDGWDDAIRESVPQKLANLFIDIFGEKAMKELIIKESNEDTEYFILPLGARIPMPTTVKSVEKTVVNGKNCLRLLHTYNTKLKSYSYDPGPAYQELRRRYNLAPKNIEYSNIEITGSASQIVDPLTSLDYGVKVNRKIKTIIHASGDEQIPITIEEQMDFKLDYIK